MLTRSDSMFQSLLNHSETKQPRKFFKLLRDSDDDVVDLGYSCYYSWMNRKATTESCE